MNTLKIVAISGIVAAVVAGGLVFLFPKQVSTVASNLGALAGPDIPSPYLRWGGVAQYAAHTDSFASATTTPFAAQSPSATSTLMLGSGCNFTLASTSAKSVVFAKATTAFATTTLLFQNAIGAGAQGAVVATSSADTFIFAPNTWLVASLVGGAGNDSPTGTCSVRWQVL